MARSKEIQLPPSYYGSGELLGHLQAECDRTGYELSRAHEAVFYGLRHNPDERLIALLHAWWCYDCEKLLSQIPGVRHPKPRIYLSVWMNQRGALIVSWRPTRFPDNNLANSDFRSNPCIPYTKEDRLIVVRDFRYATVFHEPTDHNAPPPSFDVRPRNHENRVAVNALLLQAAAALIGELKKRLSFCFTVTMIEDVYITWRPNRAGKWDFRAPVTSWEIKNVAENEKLEALKLLDGFEQTYGCPLARFVDVAFGQDQKPRTGPFPSPHTKVERSARRLKALGYPKLTPAVIRQYMGLLRDYRSDLLPHEDRPPSNVVPFGSKK